MPPLEFKVVMIGAVAVGKSAIANRLQFQIFEDDYQPTIGAGYIPYKTTFEGKEIELQIWDTAGMERYKSLGSIYYRDAKAAVIVYDQTSLETADALQSWLQCFRATVKTSCYIAIAGNKDDLSNKIVPSEKIKAWCDENGFDFFLTSAKTGTGVNEMFNALIKSVVQLNDINVVQKAPQLSSAEKSNSGGCCGK
ncbi:small GTP-binding protein [Tritrichomonas foetus]|uniref:Small GTP-binding protein n=1 Tax=Tritrichomonas foetus TaxID=1144522 RepID=A0A1J4KZH0_9EUKA|nr:small GTP-binding protein [Tritrichomonas foetus]|eukprot:OHT16655.1 small GTP-binding protein [Tritrichomonas foetus]